MMFDGDARARRRRVDLRGRREREAASAAARGAAAAGGGGGAAAAAAEARRAREERARARALAGSQARVAAVWRGRAAREILRSALRREWAAVPATVGEISCHEWRLALGCCAAGGGSGDAERLAALGRRALVRGFPACLSAAAEPGAPALRKLRARLLCSCCWAVLGERERATKSGSGGGGGVEVLLAVALAATDVAAWERHMPGSGGAAGHALRSTAVGERGFFQAAAGLIRRGSYPAGSRAAAAMAELFQRTVLSGALVRSALRRLLTIPGAAAWLAPAWPCCWEPFCEALSAAVPGVTGDSPGSQEAPGGRKDEMKLDPCAASQLLENLLSAVELTGPFSTRTYGAEKSLDWTYFVRTIAGLRGFTSEALAPRDGDTEMLDAVGEGRARGGEGLLARLHGALALEPIVASCFPAPAEAATPGMGLQGAGKALCEVVRSDLHSLRGGPRGQLVQALAGLAFGCDFVPRLWNQLRGPGALVSTRSSERWWVGPLGLLCEVYGYFLQMTDEAEFFEKQRPLPLKEVALLIHLLKNAVYLLVMADRVDCSDYDEEGGWEGPRTGEAGMDGEQGDLPRATLLAASGLLQQLHTCNVRNEFVAEEAFHPEPPVLVNDRLLADLAEPSSPASVLLRVAPCLMPFPDRLGIFSHLVREDHKTLPGMRVAHFLPSQPAAISVTLRKDRLEQEAFTQLHHRGWNLKKVIKVNFINEFGVPEAGIDGGGLFKDFLLRICREAFSPICGLFRVTPDERLYPSPASVTAPTWGPSHLARFEFLGLLLGKALYEGVLVELPFAGFFLSKLLGHGAGLNDLATLDRELYNNLCYLKGYDGDFADLGLCFALDTEGVQGGAGGPQTVELIPGGRDLSVTAGNALRYVHMVAHHRLNTEIKQQSAAFLRGFHQIIEPQWIAMFDRTEMQELLAGAEGDIDASDLRAHTLYSGGYGEGHPVVERFWRVFGDLEGEEQRSLLKFATSCSRPPLQGFAALEPHFCIHMGGQGEADGGVARLPSASTCLNLLKLPPYRSDKEMLRKMRYALDADAGFDLS